MTVPDDPTRREPIPGLYDRVLRATRAAYPRMRDRKKRPYTFHVEALDDLTVDELYAQSPYPTVTNVKPNYTDIRDLRDWYARLERATDGKGINQWADNVGAYLHKQANPTRKYL